MISKTTVKSYITLIKRINERKLIEEKELNRIKNFLSRDYHTCIKILDDNNFNFSFYKLSYTQQVKGKDYLIKKYLKVNGKRRNNKALNENLSEYFYEAVEKLYEGCKYSFTFSGFKEISNGFYTLYMPRYTLKVDNIELTYFHYAGLDYEDEETILKGYNLTAYNL